MKAIYIVLATVIFSSATFAADISRPNLELKSADIAKEQIGVVNTTNNIMLVVRFKREATPELSAFIKSHTEHLTGVSVSVDGKRVTDLVTMARSVRGDTDVGVCLLFFGKHRGDAAEVLRILKK
jgi:hypothetical protein